MEKNAGQAIPSVPKLSDNEIEALFTSYRIAERDDFDFGPYNAHEKKWEFASYSLREGCKARVILGRVVRSPEAVERLHKRILAALNEYEETDA